MAVGQTARYNLEKSAIRERNGAETRSRMRKRLKNFDAKKTGIFAAGVLFGTAGIKILAGQDAKKVYTHCTAAVLRAKDCVMQKLTDIQENAEDIYAEARQINEDRAAGDQEYAGEEAAGNEETGAVAEA